jgi:hypothetical protein
MSIPPHVVEELRSSELVANLRIIAADAKGLRAVDRSAIETAAAEIEIAYRQILTQAAQIDELAAHSIALRERLAAAEAAAPKQSWSISGVIQARFR